MNYLKLYWLESYLFNTVQKVFLKNGKLNAFDFFCIVIWKANRAKSKIALKLLKKDQTEKDLNKIVEDLTQSLYNAKDHRERLEILISKWGFRLPMASAILTVLYPKDFTVYDTRVCSILGKFDNIQNKSKFEDIWNGYCQFKKMVASKAPQALTLRNKDRYLWGQSFAQNLNKDINDIFSKTTEEEID